jgi:hypothetical protein
MRTRTFRVPFSRVAPEAHELEWGPEDFIVIRPLLAKSPGELAAMHGKLDEASKGTEGTREAILLEILRDAVVQWSLTGEDGEAIPMPKTWAEVDTLPSGLASALFEFLFTFRGDGPDPTTAAQPS